MEKLWLGMLDIANGLIPTGTGLSCMTVFLSGQNDKGIEINNNSGKDKLCLQTSLKEIHRICQFGYLYTNLIGFMIGYRAPTCRGHC